MLQRISLLMCVCNGLEITRNCIESLYRNTQTSIPWSLRVVDQGSKDGTLEYLYEASERYETLKLIPRSENAGYGGGLHIAYEDLKKSTSFINFETIGFLNNDLLFNSDPLWMDKMYATLYSSERVAMVGPITRPGGAKSRQEIDNPFVQEQQGDFQVGSLCGFCYFARGSVLEDRINKCGFIFDPVFIPGYYEETDLCSWIKEQDLELWVSRSAYVHHLGQATSTKVLGSEWQNIVTRNRQIYFARWGKLPSMSRLGKDR